MITLHPGGHQMPQCHRGRVGLRKHPHLHLRDLRPAPNRTPSGSVTLGLVEAMTKVECWRVVESDDMHFTNGKS